MNPLTVGTKDECLSSDLNIQRYDGTIIHSNEIVNTTLTNREKYGYCNACTGQDISDCGTPADTGGENPACVFCTEYRPDETGNLVDISHPIYTQTQCTEQGYDWTYNDTECREKINNCNHDTSWGHFG